MRAIIYTRVSSDAQEANHSLPSQLAACRRYAEQQSCHIVAELEDVMSGAKLDRPGLTKARDLMRARTADTLIVYCSDRLTRSLAHSLLLREEFRDAGVTLHCVTKGESQNTPEGNLFESIEASFAEYERLKIAERMSRGRKAALEQGKVFCGAAPPFGYRYAADERGSLVIEAEEAAVVRMLYDWYVHEEMGAHRIIDRLSDLGILSPSDRRRFNLAPKTKRGLAQWCSTTVLHILRNPTYKGEYPMKHAGETMIIPVPVIIDPVTWEAVAQKRQDRKRFARRNAHHLYLLGGRVRCGQCAAACTGMLMNQVRRYYRCLRTYHHGIYSEELCKLPMFRIEHLESTVWHWIDTEVLNETHIRAAVQDKADNVGDERARLEAERAAYQQQIDATEGQIARLAQLYAAGLFEMHEIAAQKSQLDAAKISCQREVTRLDQHLATMHTIGDRTEALCALVQAVRAKLDAGVSETAKRQIIDLLDVEVKLYVKEKQKIAEVVCHLTLDEARLLVAQVTGDAIVNTTSRHSDRRWFAAL